METQEENTNEISPTPITQIKVEISFEGDDSIKEEIIYNMNDEVTVEVTKLEVPVEYEDTNKMENMDVLDSSVDDTSNTSESQKIVKEKIVYVYCEICKKKCSSEKIREAHMSMHDESRKFECDVCTYRFTCKAHLVQHQAKHSDPQFFCNICEWKTKYKHKHVRHIAMHEKEMKDGVFLTNLMKKKKSKKGAKKTEEVKDLFVSKNLGEAPDVFSYCPICQLKCTNEKVLENHMSVHDEKRKYQCTHCTYRFHCNAHLLQHMSKHSDAKFYCPQCQFNTKYKHKLSRHISRQHRELSNPPTQTETNNPEMKEEVQEETTEVKAFHTCYICNFKTYNPLTLERHRKLHDITRLHICEVCAYRFDTKYDLQRHMTKHAGKTHCCRICGVWLKSEQAVSVHMAVHEGKRYSCEVCGRVYSSKPALSSHISNYHKKKFTCKVCCLDFKSGSNYHQHMKKHLKKEMAMPFNNILFSQMS